MPYDDLPARQATAEALATAAYLAQARQRAASGSEGTYLKRWAAAYECRAAAADQNPAWADRFLPTVGSAPVAGTGLPQLPAGVVWAVDEVAPGTITLTVGLATGVAGLHIHAEGESLTQDFEAELVPDTDRRVVVTFDAPGEDGLVTVTLTPTGRSATSFYLPVLRAAFRTFREQSRLLRYAFQNQLPRPDAAYLARLARLVGLEAAARNGQPALFHDLGDALARLPALPDPIALYPHPRHAR